MLMQQECLLAVDGEGGDTTEPHQPPQPAGYLSVCEDGNWAIGFCESLYPSVDHNLSQLKHVASVFTETLANSDYHCQTSRYSALRCFYNLLLLFILLLLIFDVHLILVINY